MKRGIQEGADKRFPFTFTSDDFKLDFSSTDFIPISWRRETVGETGPELIKPDSEFRKKLSEIARQKRGWIKFIVWADSFEAYRLARAVVDKENENIFKNDPQGAALLKDVADGKLSHEAAWEKFKGFKLEAGWKPLVPDLEIGFGVRGFEVPPD